MRNVDSDGFFSTGRVPLGDLILIEEMLVWCMRYKIGGLRYRYQYCLPSEIVKDY